MTKKQSAGILVYRKNGSTIEVLLAHPGGPYWKNKDTWTIPKGELEENEELITAAYREFHEETGLQIDTSSTPLDLGFAKQSSGKTNYIWGVESNPDVSAFSSITFTMEWPPKSGSEQEFPESDRVGWFTLPMARKKIYGYQEIFLDRLIAALGIVLTPDPEQQSLL